jgi:hypothetical protein
MSSTSDDIDTGKFAENSFVSDEIQLFSDLTVCKHDFQSISFVVKTAFSIINVITIVTTLIIARLTQIIPKRKFRAQKTIFQDFHLRFSININKKSVERNLFLLYIK